MCIIFFATYVVTYVFIMLYILIVPYKKTILWLVYMISDTMHIILMLNV